MSIYILKNFENGTVFYILLFAKHSRNLNFRRCQRNASRESPQKYLHYHFHGALRSLQKLPDILESADSLDKLLNLLQFSSLSSLFLFAMHRYFEESGTRFITNIPRIFTPFSRYILLTCISYKLKVDWDECFRRKVFRQVREQRQRDNCNYILRSPFISKKRYCVNTLIRTSYYRITDDLARITGTVK